MQHLAITLALILLGACAGSPTAPPAASSRTSPAAAVPAIAPAEGGIPPGYTLVERDGVRMICTRTKETGSRLSKEVCLTEAQYVDLQMRGENVWQDLDKSIDMSCGNARGGSCGQ